MAVAEKTWPGTLPSKSLLGFIEETTANTIRTDTSAGPAKVRRRFTSAPTTFQLPFVLTEDQADTLITFYTNSSTGVSHGAKTFDGFSHPRTDSSTDIVWRFLEPPKLVCVAKDIYRTTLKLELLP